VLAPLRSFSLQPKGFFRRTRGRIPESMLQHDWRCLQIPWINRRGSLRGRGCRSPFQGRDLQAEVGRFLCFFRVVFQLQFFLVFLHCFVNFWSSKWSKILFKMSFSSKVLTCVSTAQARADRGSAPPENHKKTQKPRPANQRVSG
jgi:hypothetical protein